MRVFHPLPTVDLVAKWADNEMTMVRVSGERVKFFIGVGVGFV